MQHCRDRIRLLILLTSRHESPGNEFRTREEPSTGPGECAGTQRLVRAAFELVPEPASFRVVGHRSRVLSTGVKS
jgi:hypothetical protein